MRAKRKRHSAAFKAKVADLFKQFVAADPVPGFFRGRNVRSNGSPEIKPRGRRFQETFGLPVVLPKQLLDLLA